MPRAVLQAVSILLPVLLSFSAIRTYQELQDQKPVYLRSRVASLAARLETFPSSVPENQWQDILADEEASLADLAILERASSPALAPLWEGRELFRTERIQLAGEPVFRAYVPFHSHSGLRVARIDLAESGADFLVEHASHHLWVVAIGGIAILFLWRLNVQSEKRAALAETRHLEIEHLAHIGKMSAVLAHEIRNPLGTIKGYAQLLGEQASPQQAPLVAPILTESSRLETLVKDLLLYGRPAQPQFQTIDSEQITTLLAHHSRSTGVEIALPPFTLETDPNLLEQILLNLLRNATEAVRGRPHGLVWVEAHLTATHVTLRVADNGPGLSEEALRRLFEPFFTSKASGTGLGLCISRKLASALGGALEVRNFPQGGAIAELRLPLNRSLKEA